MDIGEDDLRLRVLKGFHGLHNYANEFWFQHLLQCAKYGIQISHEEEMMDAVEDLLEIWKQDPGIAAKALKLDDTTTKDNIENEIHALDKEESSYPMGQDILTLRAFLAQEKYAHQEAHGRLFRRTSCILRTRILTSISDLRSLELRHDPTYFSDINQRYQDIVQLFVSCNIEELPPGCTPEMLDMFRTTYFDTAFTCRYRNCPRFSDGFHTGASRDEHEKGHIKPLRCADPSCVFFDRGFNSRTGLAKHNRKYHPKPEEAEPPTFDSVKPPEPVEVIPAPPLPPPPPPQRTPTPPRQPTPPSPPPTTAVPKQRAERAARIRVSRAKRGQRVHACSRCSKVFSEMLQTHKWNLTLHIDLHKSRGPKVYPYVKY